MVIRCGSTRVCNEERGDWRSCLGGGAGRGEPGVCGTRGRDLRQAILLVSYGDENEFTRA